MENAYVQDYLRLLGAYIFADATQDRRHYFKGGRSRTMGYTIVDDPVICGPQIHQKTGKKISYDSDSENIRNTKPPTNPDLTHKPTMQAGETGDAHSGMEQPLDLVPPSPSLASHALRNPLVPVIQPVQKKNKQTDKLSAAVSCEILQEKCEAFLADLQAFEEMQRATINELAEKHSRKPEYMETILRQCSLYKKEHSSNLQNAKVFRKAKELNEGTQFINK